MVTELLGPTLSDLLTICGNKFSLKTTLMIGMQIVLGDSHRSTGSKSFTTSTICSATSNLKIS